MLGYYRRKDLIVMDAKTFAPLYRLIKWGIACFYKMEVVGRENLPEGAAILVGNHAQMNGPIACELFFPGNRYTWCAAQMMEMKEVPAYAFQDFWSMKPKAVRWFYKLASYAIAPLSVLIFNNAQTIPVYHDMRVMTTFRHTVQKLEESAKIVIFPEKDEPYNGILCAFQEHFVDVASLYCRRAKKALPFVPMYICPALKKMFLGKPIYFDEDVPLEQERRRICGALMEEITRMAESLPTHRVVPYRNMPKKDYPLNRTDEANK